MIKNIVFDMGGVLVNFDPNRYTNKVTDNIEDAKLLRDEIFASVEWIRSDRGELEYEDMREIFLSRIPIRLHEGAKHIIDDWVSDIPTIPGMEELAKDLKTAGYHIYLLSNTCERFHQFRKLIPALQYFDGEYISADWHLIKPEIEIYQSFCAHFRLIPTQCIFIDDSPMNIESANRAGMNGYVFHGSALETRNYLEKLLGVRL